MQPEAIPISLVAHAGFCERRVWLESVGESPPSIAMEAGTRAHQGIDGRQDDRTMRRRSVDVHNATLNIVGRCDIVELDGPGVRVVEFKSSPLSHRRSVSEQLVIQLALQGLCLESMGFAVSGYGVYFATSRRMIDVSISDDERSRAVEALRRVETIIASNSAPLPLVNDSRCERCSHASVCLPDERHEETVRRRIHASDPDGQVLHLTSPGSRASIREGRVRVMRGDEDLGAVPIERVQALVLHGNVDVSSGLIRELLWRAVPVMWCSWGGNVVGYAHTARVPNGGPRVSQHVASHVGDLILARELIAPKIANQATQLRRGSRGDVAQVVRELRDLDRKAQRSASVTELLGHEGAAASKYFGAFAGMLAGGVGGFFVDRWCGRIGRGAGDPLNVSLNVAYGLLLSDCIRAVHVCGLDPHAGFVHSSSRNKPALALDLMEQFRPLIADSVIVTAINNGELIANMFSSALGGWRLRDEGRRVIIKVYERRMGQQFTHPVFGYRVAWRRALEVQARMILGVLDGTQERYVGIRTR